MQQAWLKNINFPPHLLGKNHDMKTYGMEVRAQWQSVPKFTMDDHFTAEERTPGIY
jgi:hypothetical protein